MTAEKGREGPGWLWVIVWPLIAAGSSSLLTYFLTVGTIADGLAARAPVVVLEEEAFVERHGSVERGLEEAKLRARALRDAGYIVLEEGTVVAYPDYVEVRP